MRTLILSAILLGVSTPLAAQPGFVLAGTWTYGHEVSVFRPCNSSAELWLWFEDEAPSAAHQELAEGPYTPLFVRIAAWFDSGPRAAFAEEYDATLRGTRLDSIRPSTPKDCEGIDPPIWTEPTDRICSDPTTLGTVECLTNELVRADLQLQRYTEEALHITGSTPSQMDSFMLAQRAWDRFRDAQCWSVYETFIDGSWRGIQHLGCRITLANLRKQFMWDTYLRGTATDLLDPSGN